MGAFEYNFNLKKSNIISYKNRAYIERVFNLKKKNRAQVFYSYLMDTHQNGQWFP